MKKIIALSIMICIIHFYIPLGNFFAQGENTTIKLIIGDENMVVNNNIQEVDPGRGTTPQIVNSRTMLPIRAVIEAIGGTITWEEAEKIITINVENNIIILSMTNPTYAEMPVYPSGLIGLYQGSKAMKVNGEIVLNDVPPMIINDRTFMPLRFVAENVGCEVLWDGDIKEVTVSYNTISSPTPTSTPTQTSTPKPTSTPIATTTPSQTLTPSVALTPTPKYIINPTPIPQDAKILSNLVMYLGSDNKLHYNKFANRDRQEEENTVPDFSYCGYMGGGVKIPDVEVKKTISPVEGDDLINIQSAIDEVSALEPDENGIRGAVLLKKGRYEVNDTININTSGVVLRGEGQGSEGTVIYAPKPERYDIIRMEGKDVVIDNKSSSIITDDLVPLGKKSFNVKDSSHFKVGDRIYVIRKVNQEWLNYLDMVQYGWTTEVYRTYFEREIISIEGNKITVDMPIVDAIYKEYGGGLIAKIETDERISNSGVENLRLESAYSSDDDSSHAWNGVYITKAKNSWVRKVTGIYIGYSLIKIQHAVTHFTVEDCAMLEHKAPIAGGHRYSFTVNGRVTGVLIQRCYASFGRHSFVTGSRATGPIAFVDCVTYKSKSVDGPHHRWATGLLFDNLKVGDLRVENRRNSGTGHGWAGAQVMFWNCESNNLVCDTAPTAMSWSVGCIHENKRRLKKAEPEGMWQSVNEHVYPRSMYYSQLYERLGPEGINNVMHPKQAEGTIWNVLLEWKGEGDLKDYLDK